jgi:hypothetical protein
VVLWSSIAQKGNGSTLPNEILLLESRFLSRAAFQVPRTIPLCFPRIWWAQRRRQRPCKRALPCANPMRRSEGRGTDLVTRTLGGRERKQKRAQSTQTLGTRFRLTFRTSIAPTWCARQSKEADPEGRANCKLHSSIFIPELGSKPSPKVNGGM